jgi:hypothetical protein
MISIIAPALRRISPAISSGVPVRSTRIASSGGSRISNWLGSGVGFVYTAIFAALINVIVESIKNPSVRWKAIKLLIVIIFETTLSYILII